MKAGAGLPVNTIVENKRAVRPGYSKTKSSKAMNIK